MSIGPRPLDRARADLAKPDLAGALAALDDLLGLPPNRATPDAQALVGEVRLRLGDTARARAEFETYLNRSTSTAGSRERSHS